MLHKYIQFIICLFFLCAGSYLYFNKLSDQPIARWDEETNMQVVSELVTKQTFPYLFLNGKPFFEKGPLWYFITSCIIKNFGSSLANYRLLSSVSALGILCLLLYITLHIFGITTMSVSALVFLSIPQLVTNNPDGIFSTHTFRSADGDSLFSFCIFLASILYFQNKTTVLNKLGTIITALAFLTKGPLAFVPMILFLLSHKQTYSNNSVQNKMVSHLAIFSIIVVPWYGLEISKYGLDFINNHFFYHIMQRVLMPIEGHSYPFFHYIGLLVNPKISGLSILFFPSLILYFVKQNKNYFLSYLVTFIVAFLGILSVNQTRLSWYILPVYPYICIFIGFEIATQISHFLSSIQKITHNN